MSWDSTADLGVVFRQGATYCCKELVLELRERRRAALYQCYSAGGSKLRCRSPHDVDHSARAVPHHMALWRYIAPAQLPFGGRLFPLTSFTEKPGLLSVRSSLIAITHEGESVFFPSCNPIEDCCHRSARMFREDRVAMMYSLCCQDLRSTKT